MELSRYAEACVVTGCVYDCSGFYSGKLHKLRRAQRKVWHDLVMVKESSSRNKEVNKNLQQTESRSNSMLEATRQIEVGRVQGPRARKK